MNIFEYAAANEMCFEQFLESVGKTRKTTLFSENKVVRQPYSRIFR